MMNKTVSCNISGTIFNLEEQGYELLLNYLNKLKKQLSSIEGGEEIFSDIELRIAELFSGRLAKYKEVILLEDVQEVIQQLGNPEDYIGEEDTDQKQKKSNTFEQSEGKQFMRDSDNGMIGGVCVGLSAYFGLELTLVRAIFIILGIVTGFGVLLYIVLWVITPDVKSHSDRLRMKGKPVNIDMIVKEVERAAEKAASKVDNYSKKNFKKKNFEGVIKRTNKFGRFIASLFGMVLIIGSILGIVMFLSTTLSDIGFFTSNDGEQLISIYAFSKVIFNSGGQHFFAWMGILGSVLIPLIAFFILGISLVLKLVNSWLKFLYIFMFVIWVVSFSTIGITGFQVGREFTYLGESEEKIGELKAEKLIVEIPNSFSDHRLSKDNNYLKVNSTNLSLVDLLEDDVKSGWVELDIIDSKDSLFHIYRETQARGITPKQGLRRAINIVHETHIDEGKLVLQPFYTYPIEDKIRDQRVRIVIEKPVHSTIEWKGNRKQLVMTKRGQKYVR